MGSWCFCLKLKKASEYVDQYKTKKIARRYALFAYVKNGSPMTHHWLCEKKTCNIPYRQFWFINSQMPLINVQLCNAVETTLVKMDVNDRYLAVYLSHSTSSCNKYCEIAMWLTHKKRIVIFVFLLFELFWNLRGIICNIYDVICNIYCVTWFWELNTWSCFAFCKFVVGLNLRNCSSWFVTDDIGSWWRHITWVMWRNGMIHLMSHLPASWRQIIDFNSVLGLCWCTIFLVCWFIVKCSATLNWRIIVYES